MRFPRVDEIWINELVTYQKIYQVLDQILELKEKHQAHLKMLLHDFFLHVSGGKSDGCSGEILSWRGCTDL